MKYTTRSLQRSILMEIGTPKRRIVVRPNSEPVPTPLPVFPPPAKVPALAKPATAPVEVPKPPEKVPA